MTLKSKIEAYKEGFKAKVPKEAQELMHNATQELQNSAQLRNTVKVGDVAPDFTLKNSRSEDVALSDLLSRGPVVLSFYRGRW